MIQRIGRERQAPALDRVSEDHDRPLALVVGFGQRVEHGGEIMAAGVGNDRGELVVGHITEKAIEGRVDERLAHRRRGKSDQALILAVGHLHQTPAQPVAAAPPEHGGGASSPAQIDHAPAERGERRGHLVPAGVGDDPIEALPIDVHDPHDVAEPSKHLFSEGFPDVALVQLGVADHDDDALGRAHPTVVRDVLRGQRAEGGLDGAESHRARGDVDDPRILAPARIRLQAAEHAQVTQRARFEATAQVLDRVERGRGVGLHRDGVTGAQRLEIECGEQRDERRRGRLVATDLDAVRVGPDHVGVVHHPRGEPQDLALDAVEDLELGHRRSLG